ncbi:unnamed protein product [Timema podura]|uniref:Uncharacterized protein n=1 Tax=Timema podura TaxID=61482 RepID=A0ABN7NL41_TIMPD|nr:unnamed protein product [Timema podura]
MMESQSLRTCSSSLVCDARQWRHCVQSVTLPVVGPYELEHRVISSTCTRGQPPCPEYRVQVFHQLATSLLEINKQINTTNMKLFLVLLLAAPLVLAKPSQKSISQGSNTESKDDDSEVTINGLSYMYAVVSLVDLEDEKSSINTHAPELEFSFESNNNTYGVLVSNGKVMGIKSVKCAGDVAVDAGDDGDSVILSNLTISEAVLTYKYKVNGSDGELIEEGTLESHIYRVEDAVSVRIQKHNHKYTAELEDVKPISPGTIGDVEVSHKVLDDAVVAEMISSLQNHLIQGVDKYIAEALKVYLESAIGKTDVDDYIEKSNINYLI